MSASTYAIWRERFIRPARGAAPLRACSEASDDPGRALLS